MSSESRSVYIGNIPFDYTEEQVLEIAKSVGPVMDLKLLFDSMTGKSKGYAFVRYIDQETAESAVRNLNNFAIGNRNLRCSFSSDSNAGFPSEDNATSNDSLPVLPLGIQLFPNQTAPQAISNILAGLNTNSAMQIIKEAKRMSIKDPQLMQTLLEKCPQLAHSLVQISLLLNLTSHDMIELALNKKKPILNNLTQDHLNILKEINSLDSSDLDVLSEDEKSVMNAVRESISNGSYGNI